MSVIGFGRAAKDIDRAGAQARGDRDAIRARARDRASHDSHVMSGLSTCVVCGHEAPAADLLRTDDGQACPGCLPDETVGGQLPWSLLFMPVIPLLLAGLLSQLAVGASGLGAKGAGGVWTLAAFGACVALLGVVSGAAEMRRTSPLRNRLVGTWALCLCGGAGLSIVWSFLQMVVG